MKKRILSLLLCALLLAGLTVPAYAAHADLKEDAWYYEGVKYCLDNGIMTGVSDTAFDPNGSITRGQFVTTLYRIAKNEGNGFTGDWMFPLPFADASKIPGYAYEAIAWFSQNKIVEGHANGCFGAEEKISREQMAAILYRYVQFCGRGFQGDWMFLLDCSDRAAISDWAYEAVCWCYMNKILTGKNGNAFDPAGYTTRAEAAVVLQRFCGGGAEPVAEPEIPVVGGWTVNTEFSKFELPEAAKTAFDKATKGLAGSAIEPVAYLGSQVVAGANHAFLCKVTPIVPNAKAALKYVTVYADLAGNAEITKTAGIEEFTTGEVSFESLAGGYTASAACGGGISGDVKTAFDKATKGLAGVGYEPLALLGTQVVAGMNYAVLCKATPVVPNAQSALAIVVIYQDLQGGAEITGIVAPIPAV